MSAADTHLSAADALAGLHADALARMDAALAGRPHNDGNAFTAATKALSAYREALIQAQREHPAQGDRDRLSKLSAVIAMVIAGHFPLGAVPWAELDKARGWFVDLQSARPGLEV